jgi:hypothetical protein
VAGRVHAKAWGEATMGEHEVKSVSLIIWPEFGLYGGSVGKMVA